MKKLLYLVLILIIIGISYLKWQATVLPSPTLPTATPTPVVSQEVNDNVLQTDYFSLSYPKVATTSPVSESPDSLSWSIRYMGAKQSESGRTQTELFDGYGVNITAFPEVVGDDPSTIQAVADRQGTIDACGESRVTPIESVEIAGVEATSFSGGCLGEGTNLYLMHNDILYRITYMVVGDNEDVISYQQAVDKILFSLELF